MAVYDGFFNAEIEGEHVDGTIKYDREYNEVDFTGYFAQIAGSGVSVLDNPDSCKVTFSGGTASIAPGFLFIRGYWLRIKDTPYTVAVSGADPVAILAQLNTSQRRIDLLAQPVADTYTDALCLAVVDLSSGAVRDKRSDADVCGVIEPSGELAAKIAYAQNYIDNEIDARLDAIEADIAAQSQAVDAKISAMQSTVDAIGPPVVGTIRFSASQDVGPDWLRCDGSFVNEADYPELVAALGKLTPSADKFKLISDGQIGTQITNGVLYGGRLWAYSYDTKKLYGVDVQGTAAVKEIPVTSESAYFKNFISPSTQSPLALSIVPHDTGTGAELFLSQIINDGIGTLKSSVSPSEGYSFENRFLIFSAAFTGGESSLSVSQPFSAIEYTEYTSSGKKYYYIPHFYRTMYIPLVFSKEVSGTETYYCAIGKIDSSMGSNYSWNGALEWEKGASMAAQKTASEMANSKILQRGGPSPYPLETKGSEKTLSDFTLSTFGISFPSMARIFPNAGAYLWGKDIYMIFSGTGVIFSRTLEDGSYGYLDTTSVLGTITQFGCLDYSQDEGTLYILGQDTSNKVKVAKIVLNTLYDYANDGAWLPMIASDGVPAYIKAKEG